MNKNKDAVKPSLKNLKYDIPAGVVVFFVAIPLCMGIALASGAPVFSGLISGIIGGLIIPIISRSELSVSGPAAGLVAVVLLGIEDLGSFEAFLSALLLSGIFQLLLGFLRAGTIAYFFPSGVIKGMLAGIGIIIILKQIPYVLGIENHNITSLKFISEVNFTQLNKLQIFEQINTGSLLVGVFSVFILLLWKTKLFEKASRIPAGLVVVIMGIMGNYTFQQFIPTLEIPPAQLVNISGIESPADVFAEIRTPHFQAFFNPQTYIIAATIALVASLETLLCVEAVDKIDPYKRKTPMNKELYAQGAGNIVSGLLGGLPITSVIVRSGANVSAGGKTRSAALIHGVLLLVAVVFLVNILNLIPLASLAAILVVVGYELATPKLFKSMRKTGRMQYVPFLVTIIAIIATDLLKGILTGLTVSIFFVLKNNFDTPYFFIKNLKDKRTTHIELSENVTFMNKAGIRKILEEMEDNEMNRLIVDASKTVYMDYDVTEMLYNFKKTAKNINVEYIIMGIDIEEAYRNPKSRLSERVS